MASYQITIQMSQETVQALLANGYSLYGMKAVQGSGLQGAPLIWYSTQSYSLVTTIAWQDQYQAYISTSEIIPGAQILAVFTADISLGQTFVVQPNYNGYVMPGGTPNAISIQNTAPQPCTSGLMQLVNGGGFAPTTAFSLYGQMAGVIGPLPKVLLMFGTYPVNVGTVVEQAYGAGILIDLSGNNNVTVSFDINQGWSWDGGSWAQSVPPSSNLIPLLIQ